MKLVPFLKLVFKTVFKTGFRCGKIRAKTPKITPHRHRSKNHSSEFLSEAGTDQKNSPTEKMRTRSKTKLILRVQNNMSNMLKY